VKLIHNALKKAAMVCGLCAAVGIPAFASGIEIDVYTTLTPNSLGSPSYSAWRDNAIYALEHGLDSYGTPGTPSYYQKAQGITPYQYGEVTSFHSWLGQSDPGTSFGAAFANELGQRAAFPLVINGNGEQFSISQLGFSAVSSDPGTNMGFSFGVGSYNYSADYVGILKGDDGTLFTSDDVYITSGAATQLVDGLVGRGSGNALWPCGPGDASPCTTAAEQQAAIDAMVAVLSGTTFTGTYTLGAASGSAEFQFSSATPEPGTWLLMFGSLAAVAVTARRRSKA
jgi:hypothetical protein